MIQLFIYDLVHKKGYVYRLSNEIFNRNINFHKMKKELSLHNRKMNYEFLLGNIIRTYFSSYNDTFN